MSRATTRIRSSRACGCVAARTRARSSIFGASGDLTRRKIFPALYSLALRRLLPERFGIVGVARTEQTTKQWIAEMKKAVKEHARDELRAEVWNELADGMRYVATDFAEDEGEDGVVEALRDLDEKRG